MAGCYYCGKEVAPGIATDAGLEFCDADCLLKGERMIAAGNIPNPAVRARTLMIRRSPCPLCGATRPVDVHPSYLVWSVIFYCRTENTVHVCCRRCGRRKQSWALFVSFLVGWWSKHGLFMTPVQIGRNLAGIFGGPHPKRASKELSQLARQQLVESIPRARSKPLPPK